MNPNYWQLRLLGTTTTGPVVGASGQRRRSSIETRGIGMAQEKQTATTAQCASASVVTLGERKVKHK